MSLWKYSLRGLCKQVSLCVVLLLPVTSVGAVAAARTENPVLAAHAKSAVLMDATTGTVLFEKNEHERLPIASVTKIATMLIVFEAIDRGQVRLTDSIRTSDYAASMGGSQIYLQAGEQMTLRDMLKGIAMSSANDAAVAVAEHVAGSEANFVHLMNTKSRALGLRDTHFANTNGLPHANHYSSAYDVAVLSRSLLEHHGVTQFTGAYSDHLRQNSGKPFWLVNTNKLVRFFRGMDGIKTGYTAEAKFCLAASAKRLHFRVIAVVLGEPMAPTRNAEVTEMMNYAFSHYEIKPVYQRGQTVTLAPVMRGQLQAVAVSATRPVGLLVNKMDQSVTGRVVNDLRPLVAPVKKGQFAGVVKIVDGDKVLLSVPLIVTANIGKASMLEMLGRSLRSQFLFGVTAH